MESEKKYLLSTLWSQHGKVVGCGSNEMLENGVDFNQYAPLDLYLSGENRSYTGCVSTAASQIIYYHLLNDFLNEEIRYEIKVDVLTENDGYVNFATIPEQTFYISASGGGAGDTFSFEAINEKLSEFVCVTGDTPSDELSIQAAEFIAALNFTVGILHQSFYSTVFGTQAHYSATPYLRCGFKSACYIDFTKLQDSELLLWVTEEIKLTDEAIEIFIENLENGNPICFSLPGHAVVLDGYDKESDTFHLNYGWGPGAAESEGGDPEEAYTRWYTREEFKNFGFNDFVIDITPVYQETFTVTDSRIFGSGTLLRAVRQSAAMQGENTITFDDALADAEALEMSVTIELEDKLTLSGFNMTFFSPGEKKEGEEEEEEDEENHAASFFMGGSGSRITFDGFQGNIICRYKEDSAGAALDFSEAVQLTVSTSAANIFAGISQYDCAAILEAMRSNSLKKLLAGSQKKVAVAGSDGDDQITFDDHSLVIGNLELSAGHDTLTVTGNSCICGDIDMGSGDDVITVAAGSSIHGNLPGATELCFILSGQESAVLFEITGSAANTFENIISITIDAEHAEAQEYILFNKGDVKELLEKLHIKGGGGIVAAKDGSIRWRASAEHHPGKEEEEKTPDKIIASGETLSDSVVGAGELWIFEDGSSVTGSLNIAQGGEVKVMTGAQFVFDISSMTEENSSGIINDFSGINGTFHFALQVGAEQACGTYILAENLSAWRFHNPITVTAGGIEIGTFESGNAEEGFAYGDEHYALIFDEKSKQLTLVIESAFATAFKEDNSIELSWNKPAGATGYFVNIARKDENGIIRIFSRNNGLNIVTAYQGEYEWQVITPGLESEYREGGSFSSGRAEEEPREKGFGSSVTSTVFSAGEGDRIMDLFMAESSGVWGIGYMAKHAGLPENWDHDSKVCTQVALAGKSRYTDIYRGAEGDTGVLYLSDSENGDALFADDIFSAFPDQEKCERVVEINTICAGAGDDIIDLTSDKFESAEIEIKVYGGKGNDVIWAGKETACCLYGDEGDDCLVGSEKDDCLIGGAGDDILYGGGGCDVFAYGDPSTWGNDIIYQLEGEIELLFEDSGLRDKICEENIEGGVRFYVEGYENSSITFYGRSYAVFFGGECSKIEMIVEGGGCGGYASQNIFATQEKGVSA